MNCTLVARSFCIFATIAGFCIIAEAGFGQDLRADLIAPVNVTAPSETAGTAATTPVVHGPPLRTPDTQWIEGTLASMSLDEKIGQMLMPAYTSSGAAGLVTTYHVGGFIFQGNDNTKAKVLNATNALQAVTSTPLIFSTDCEAGLGARFTDATRFPMNMGNGSAYDLDLIRQQGAVTARECRAIGIQIGFGPVVDVNTEPINPIIGIRSFGDDPTSVAALAQAYVEGVNSEGLLSTFKHFPGHGATIGDTHLGFQEVDISLSELMSKHVAPYATLINNGIGDLVMSAHVYYPALDSTPPTGYPATILPSALTGILRDQLHFQGAVISDSFAMGALMAITDTYNGVRQGVLAGLDIILTPASTSDAFHGLKDSVTSGLIPMSRIDASVRRILALKSRVGMPEITTMPLSGLDTVGHPDDVAVGEAIGKKTIAAQLSGNVIPVAPGESLGVFVLGGYGTIFYNYSWTEFTDALEALHSNTTIVTVSSSPGSSTRGTLVNQAKTFDKVLIVSREWTPENDSNQVTLVNSMISAHIPLAYVDFGSPFQWNEYPNLQNFLCGFGCHYATQREMAKIIVGQSTAHGLWPVHLSQVISAVKNWHSY
jgi:beta-N-acetylhexosaminidase